MYELLLQPWFVGLIVGLFVLVTQWSPATTFKERIKRAIHIAIIVFVVLFVMKTYYEGKLSKTTGGTSILPMIGGTPSSVSPPILSGAPMINELKSMSNYIPPERIFGGMPTNYFGGSVMSGGEKHHHHHHHHH